MTYLMLQEYSLRFKELTPLLFLANLLLFLREVSTFHTSIITVKTTICFFGKRHNIQLEEEQVMLPLHSRDFSQSWCGGHGGTKLLTIP